MERFRPDLVIVDGIRDLVNDINDGVLAQETVERLMHLASEQRCCVVCPTGEAQEPAASPPTFDLMGDGPIDDLPF